MRKYRIKTCTYKDKTWYTAQYKLGWWWERLYDFETEQEARERIERDINESKRFGKFDINQEPNGYRIYERRYFWKSPLSGLYKTAEEATEACRKYADEHDYRGFEATKICEIDRVSLKKGSHV